MGSRADPEPLVDLPEDPARRVQEAKVALTGCNEAWDGTLQKLKEMKTRLGRCYSGRDIDWDKAQTIVNLITRLEVKMERLHHNASLYVTAIRQIDPALVGTLFRKEAASPQAQEEAKGEPSQGGAPEVEEPLQEQEETKAEE